MSNSSICIAIFILLFSEKHPWCILTQPEKTVSVHRMRILKCIQRNKNDSRDMSASKWISKYRSVIMKLLNIHPGRISWWFLIYLGGNLYNLLKKKKSLPPALSVVVLWCCINQALLCCWSKSLWRCMISRDHVSCIQINFEAKLLSTKRAVIPKKIISKLNAVCGSFATLPF